MPIELAVHSGVDGFAEDKDEARRMRVEIVLPALSRDEDICFDFSQVRYATQSFIHALIGEPLKQYGEAILDRIEFRNCSPQVQNIIEIVVDYSLGGFLDAADLQVDQI